MGVIVLTRIAESGPDVVKAYRDGTDRAISPAETLERITPHLPAMGISRVADVTGLDHLGVPVFMAVRPNSRGLTVAQGKGLTTEAAKVSAIMESVETYHAERIAAPLLLGSWRELHTERPLVDADELRTATGEPLGRDVRLLWIEGHDLARDEPVWLPFDVVHNDYTTPSLAGAPFPVTSNGLASGNHLLEATSHALCEVVERDAEALWRLTTRQEREAARVDPATVTDPACEHVLSLLARAGIAVGIWEMTTDVGLPCFLTDIAEDPRVALAAVAGARGQGCHPRREIALLRALTEAVQTRLTVISGSRDDIFRAEYLRATDPQNREAAWTACAKGETPRRFTDAATRSNATFADDLAHELERLRAVGIDRVVRVDLGGAPFGISVVRVVIPGLEHCVDPATYQPGPRARRLREAS
ncbi:ribosomal protein S12 methylthiotransferase accessory factor [Allocatelliglobosispora scoriae]|uniref:Ribosomal protein S12 methylthiotransferase accessory factor n=1 Tax=Allocatelliglobosispora scoriae TaxID=643052 RepID=A0A841BI74_9ACTN|nr:YcaO-like family protein [Allocatelliglobosispora scoriae]MBB5868817.1 ribosomal protein S12 methylthiotransferase accessory factor [Allocatelliglobosispora scoriae]